MADRVNGGQIRDTNGDVKESLNVCLNMCKTVGRWGPQQEKWQGQSKCRMLWTVA